MEQVDYLLVGGGLAAAKCAAKLRKEEARGRVAIVGAEPEPPYNRPPLSKGLPLGYEEPSQIYVFGEDFYRRHNIELILGSKMVAVDGARRIAKADDGLEFAFNKLLAATGTTPRRLNSPGGELANIFYLRVLSESLAIIEGLKSAKKAVIVGAGFIGMELASALVKNGLETTMLVREKELFTKLESADLSRFFENYYLGRGVKIIYEDSVDHFEGDRSVRQVATQAGRKLDCDLVAVAIGVTPEVSWLEGAGAELNNGVIVNEYLQSGHPDIYAAGDCANFYDPVFAKQRRIEHWDNAIKQGELAAVNMLNQKVAYNTVAYFFSDMFDISWEWLGDNSDIDAVVTRGSLAEESAIVFFLKNNKLKAAFLLMQGQKERRWAERAIIDQTEFAAGARGKLADPSYPLEALG